MLTFPWVLSCGIKKLIEYSFRHVCLISTLVITLHYHFRIFFVLLHYNKQGRSQKKFSGGGQPLKQIFQKEGNKSRRRRARKIFYFFDVYFVRKLTTFFSNFGGGLARCLLRHWRRRRECKKFFGRGYEASRDPPRRVELEPQFWPITKI